MSDSLERLYQAVVAAKDLDPATSRTARLFQRGPAKMAKKLAEEAIEVVIDAVNGNADAVVRESAEKLPKRSSGKSQPVAVPEAVAKIKSAQGRTPARRPIVALSASRLKKRR